MPLSDDTIERMRQMQLISRFMAWKLSPGFTMAGCYEVTDQRRQAKPVREGAEDEGETETGNEDCDKRCVRHRPIGFNLSSRLLSQDGMNPNEYDRS